MLTCSVCGQQGWHLGCLIPKPTADWVGLPFVEESTTCPSLDTDGSFLFAHYKPVRGYSGRGVPPSPKASLRPVRMAVGHPAQSVPLPLRRVQVPQRTL